MKKFRLVLFTIICMVISVVSVKAASIDTIDMDIRLNEQGTALVTETWKAKVSEGTEGWHPYYNIGKSEITVLSASMDGESYTVVSNWDEESSMSSKAYKTGIYKPNSSEVDVVFGISEYGSHTYQVVYQITNFVSNAADADIIYWQLFPYEFSARPKNVTIKISGPYYYPDTLDVWGYGMYGALCYVDNGSIYMTNDNKKISSSDYMTLLAKFPAGTFDTTSKLDHDFAHYQDMANEGAEVYHGEKMSVLDWILFFIPFIINAIVWIAIIVGIMRSAEKKKINYDFGEAGKKLPKDVNNFRDIPCNKDVYRAFWVADTYDLNKNRNDFFGVLLLKWIYDGNVQVQTKESKKLFKTNKEDVIIFDHEPETANSNEKNLYRYMLEAAGDNVLEKNEFKKWCKNHYSKILGWTDKVLEWERKELTTQGKINDVLDEKGMVLKYKVHRYVVDPSMKEEAIQMKGLKQFFKEFSQIHKKEPIEVKLWNEYLMYAQIFGMAKLVMERFKELYPEVIEDMDNYNFDYGTFMFLDSITSSGVSAASAARSAAQSYSSGGGGFSSGGGGGGSFGGGGGGGGFR